MGKRVKPKSSDSFESEVRRRFATLAERWGLEGPEEDGVVLPTVRYRIDRLAYTWMLNDEDRLLSVDVSMVVTGGILSIDVDDLVAEAGLGNRQQVRSSAQTWHALQQSIASHVQWLEKVHPMLTGSQAERFLEQAGARRFTPDLD